jgi:hypothetical protein
LVFTFSATELELQKSEKRVQVSDAANDTEAFEVLYGQFSNFSGVNYILEREGQGDVFRQLSEEVFGIKTAWFENIEVHHNVS